MGVAAPLGSGVPGEHAALWMRRMGFESLLPSFRPEANVCSSHAKEGEVHRAGGSSGGGRACPTAMHCDASACAAAGGNHKTLKKMWRCGGSRRALRPLRHAAARRAGRGTRRGRWSRSSSSTPPSIAGISRTDLFAKDLKQRLRALRSGRGMARQAHGPDPRPHQRRGRRSSSGELADRLSELRGHARHALRPPESEGAPLSALRRAVSATDLGPDLLLHHCAAAARRPPRAPPAWRRARSTVRPTCSSCARSMRWAGRPSVALWRQRQRRAQVGEAVRAGAQR